VADTETSINDNDDYVNEGTYYPFNNFHGTDSHLHHPAGQPSIHYSSALPSPHPRMRPYYPRPDDGYSTGQYTHEPGYGAPQAQLPPSPHYFRHAPPQMYYGSWHAYNQSVTASQQVHYPQHSILPPDAQTSKRPSFKKDEGTYGTLELNVFEVENEKLASALNFVHRNSKATLFDIDGIIADVARADEGASRFIQKRLKLGNIEERRLGLTTALSAIDDLVCDQYGNFMLQGLFEFGSADMKRKLIDAVYAQDVVALCLHMHGCRVIQKAIRCLDQEDVCKLFTEFHDKVFTFNHDPNGNHVMQRCIQVMSFFAKSAANSGDPDLASNLSDKMQFIIDDIVTHVEKLSMHRYGCRVVQRAIEHCVDHQKNAVLESIISHHKNLVADQYGNYVVQQVLVCGSEAHRAAVLKTLTQDGALLSLSMHKYASNVVESVLLHGESQHKEKILEEMLKVSVIIAIGNLHILQFFCYTSMWYRCPCSLP